MRQLSLNPAFAGTTHLSSRDQSLIITAYEDLHTRLYRYRLDDGVAEIVSYIGEGSFHGTELSDRIFYLLGQHTDKSTLMQLRLGQTQAEKLEFGTVLAYRASEKWLVWRTVESPAMLAAPLPALSPVREIDLVDEGMLEAFALSGSSLYYVDQGKIMTLNLPDGMPAEVAADYLPSDGGPSLAASANGDLAVVSLTALSTDLMIATPRPSQR